MYTIEQTRLDSGTLRFRVVAGGAPLCRGELLTALMDDEALRDSLRSSLAAVPFEAFKWEMPPWSTGLLDAPFEYVVRDAPWLERTVDETAFAHHFAAADGDIATFDNLGGDATLVVPCPRSNNNAYGHLAAFVRNAHRWQIHRLLSSVARALQSRLTQVPLWLSTAGDGVAWLHIRIDERPKYFGYGPYTVVG